VVGPKAKPWMATWSVATGAAAAVDAPAAAGMVMVLIGPDAAGATVLVPGTAAALVPQAARPIAVATALASSAERRMRGSGM
jgi:hypothetical protein